MDDIILSVKTLPEPLRRHFRFDSVKVHEENGVITLTPFDNQSERLNAIESLCGMFEGKLSTEDYVLQKQLDKELER